MCWLNRGYFDSRWHMTSWLAGRSPAVILCHSWIWTNGEVISLRSEQPVECINLNSSDVCTHGNVLFHVMNDDAPTLGNAVLLVVLMCFVSEAGKVGEEDVCVCLIICVLSAQRLLFITSHIKIMIKLSQPVTEAFFSLSLRHLFTVSSSSFRPHHSLSFLFSSTTFT